MLLPQKACFLPDSLLNNPGGGGGVGITILAFLIMSGDLTSDCAVKKASALRLFSWSAHVSHHRAEMFLEGRPPAKQSVRSGSFSGQSLAVKKTQRGSFTFPLDTEKTWLINVCSQLQMC